MLSEVVKLIGDARAGNRHVDDVENPNPSPSGQLVTDAVHGRAPIAP